MSIAERLDQILTKFTFACLDQTKVHFNLSEETRLSLRNLLMRCKEDLLEQIVASVSRGAEIAPAEYERGLDEYLFFPFESMVRSLIKKEKRTEDQESLLKTFESERARHLSEVKAILSKQACPAEVK